MIRSLTLPSGQKLILPPLLESFAGFAIKEEAVSWADWRRKNPIAASYYAEVAGLEDPSDIVVVAHCSFYFGRELSACLWLAEQLPFENNMTMTAADWQRFDQVVASAYDAWDATFGEDDAA